LLRLLRQQIKHPHDQWHGGMKGATSSAPSDPSP
jgi:hypothetical protein